MLLFVALCAYQLRGFLLKHSIERFFYMTSDHLPQLVLYVFIVDLNYFACTALLFLFVGPPSG
jgi:hypothetical protein